MKHAWRQIKAPYLDKVVDKHDKVFVDRRTAHDNAMFHPMNKERVVMMPGWYVCDTCGAFIQANYAPPDDWKHVNIIPDCSEEVMRTIHGS